MFTGLYGVEIEICDIPKSVVKNAINNKELDHFFEVDTDTTLECNNNCRNCIHRYVCYDNAFNSHLLPEIKTKHPIKFTKENLNYFKELFEFFKSTTSGTNSSTGIHIHVDATKLTLKQIKSILLEYIKEQNEIYPIVSERESSYAQPIFVSKRDILNLIDTYDVTNFIGGKEYAIETQNIGNDGIKQTIEFRLFDSTTNFKKFMLYCLWVDRLVKKAIGKSGYSKKYKIVKKKILDRKW